MSMPITTSEVSSFCDMLSLLKASGEDRARVIFGSGGLINGPDGGAPIPWQRVVEPLDRMLGDARENVGEPGLGIDVIHLGGLCRPPNYAERIRFPQDSS
jgi:hypothetical protein